MAFILLQDLQLISDISSYVPPQTFSHFYTDSILCTAREKRVNFALRRKNSRLPSGIARSGRENKKRKGQAREESEKRRGLIRRKREQFAQFLVSTLAVVKDAGIRNAGVIPAAVCLLAGSPRVPHVRVRVPGWTHVTSSRARTW